MSVWNPNSLQEKSPGACRPTSLAAAQQEAVSNKVEGNNEHSGSFPDLPVCTHIHKQKLKRKELSQRNNKKP